MQPMTKAATEMFLKEYGGELFSRVLFRPGAGFTSPFGLDDTFDTIRIHNAIDRGKDSSGKYPIYNPFTVSRAEYLKDYPSFGTMLILHTTWGFQVRIAHIEELSHDMELAMAYGNPICPGLFIGEAGAAGKSKDNLRHTHTEIVSEDLSCEVLDEVLIRKVGMEALTREFSDKDVRDFAAQKNLDCDPLAVYAAEREKRRVFFLNQYVCDRMDYHSDTPRRFYSSRALFGM